MRPIVTAAVALALLAPPLGAEAQTRVHVEGFDGPGASVAQRQVEEAFEAASGVELTDDAGSAAATVSGRVQNRGRRWRARLSLVDAGGTTLSSRTLRSRRPTALANRIRRWAEREAVPALRDLAPAAPEPADEPEVTRAEPEPARASERATEPPSDAAEDAGGGTVRGPPNPIRIELGAAFTHRRLTYVDDIFGELRPYELPVWPYVQLGFEYFIGHHTPELDGLWGLSVYAQGRWAPGLSSRNDNGATFPTTSWGLDLGARYRVFVDEVTLLGDLSYRPLTFAFEDADELTPRPTIPNVEYHMLRAGLGYRWDIGFGFFFMGAAGLAYPLASGEILGEDWFPRGEAGSVDAEAGFGQRVDDFELRARFVYQRFFYSFNPQPEDARVAGGALDQYFSGVVDVAYTPSF